MREIKFRAWDKEKQIMINDLNGWSKGYQDKYELMQFTGLKDENGKEIYEGDIFDSPAKTKFKIVWWVDGWFYQNVRDEKPIGHLIEVAKDWNVIGNIYENLELIK
ncbi:MAG: hypothetical protein UR20_C0054G0013 [Candidatus Woesebacteria bacterium GW2011_GWE2_31_6]|nr:MAG: hypothetical protein UR20_C0054G0013 [Candidatus Woesebacteria bacterium GW2011_GWE2_31_6]